MIIGFVFFLLLLLNLFRFCWGHLVSGLGISWTHRACEQIRTRIEALRSPWTMPMLTPPVREMVFARMSQRNLEYCQVFLMCYGLAFIVVLPIIAARERIVESLMTPSWACVDYHADCGMSGYQKMRRKCTQLPAFLFVGLVSVCWISCQGLRGARTMDTMHVGLYVCAIVHLLDSTSVKEYDHNHAGVFVIVRLVLSVLLGKLRFVIPMNLVYAACQLYVLSIADTVDDSGEDQLSYNKPMMIRDSGYCILVVLFSVMMERSSLVEIASVLEASISSESKRIARSLLDAMCDAVVETENLRVRGSCPKFSALVLKRNTYDASDGVHFLDFIKDCDRERVSSTILQMECSVALLLHTELCCAYRSYISVQLFAACYTDDFGNLCHFIGIREDTDEFRPPLSDLPASSFIDRIPTNANANNGTVSNESDGDGLETVSSFSGSSSGHASFTLVRDPPAHNNAEMALWIDSSTSECRIIGYTRSLLGIIGLDVAEALNDWFKKKGQDKESFHDWLTGSYMTFGLHDVVTLQRMHFYPRTSLDVSMYADLDFYLEDDAEELVCLTFSNIRLRPTSKLHKTSRTKKRRKPVDRSTWFDSCQDRARGDRPPISL